MANNEDIIMNSMSEIVGSRIGRKKVERGGKLVELVSGDVQKLDSPERKLIAV